MADSRRADNRDAAEVHEIERNDGQNKEPLPALLAGTDSEEAAMLRNEQSHQAGARHMLAAVEGGCGRKRQAGGVPSRLLTWVVARRRLFSCALFQALDIAWPLLVVVWIIQRGLSLPLHSKRLLALALFSPCTVLVIEPLCNLFMDVVAYALTEDTRQFNHDDGLFGLVLHFRLINRLVLPIRLAIEFILLGAKMLWEHLLTSVSLNVQEHYSKCLGNLGCLPRTLADLYGSKTCPVLAWWQNSSGHSRQDVLRAGACLYRMLSTSEYGEPSQNYFNCDVLGACVVAYVLYKTMLAIDTVFKNTVKDITAVATLYKIYTEKRRRRATSRMEAYYAASVECFRKAHIKPVTPLGKWMLAVMRRVVRLLMLLAITMQSAADILDEAF